MDNVFFCLAFQASDFVCLAQPFLKDGWSVCAMQLKLDHINAIATYQK